MQTMAQWYGLKEQYADFTIDQDTHARLLFARTALHERIMRILRRSFRTSTPPKFILFGDWGVGKTHTLRHIQYVLGAEADFPARTVFVELPDIAKKSTFQVAHASLLDALGPSIVQQWVTQFQAMHAHQAPIIIQERSQSADIAKAFATLIGYGEASRIAWDWLRGLSLSPGDARSVGLPPSLTQSQHFVSVLRVLGGLCKEIDNSALILILDEATKLDNVTDDDAINHWLNSFKLIASDDLREFGLIVSASYHDPDEMPPAISDQQVQSRLGPHAFINLPRFEMPETREFLASLLDQWIDPILSAALIGQNIGDAESESVGQYFPFTDDAFERFVEYATMRIGGFTTPRDIQKYLDDIVNRAMDDDRHIISSEYLENVVAEG